MDCKINNIFLIRSGDIAIGCWVVSLVLWKDRWIMSKHIKKDMKRYGGLYLLVIPVLLYYVIFHYIPMGGVLMAFENYRPKDGILGSEWVGLQHFRDFFGSSYFGRTLRNTLTISITQLVFGFPAPIVLALLINELKDGKFKKVVQTISYLPHFISLVIICGMVKEFVSTNGFITQILIKLFDIEQVSLLTKAKYYLPIHVISGIWSTVGFGTIIYLAALSGVNTELYDASAIDGAGRFRQTLHVTLPGIAPTIILKLIMNIGSIMSLGHEKIILLYNEGIYETADVISTYVYRKGLVDAQYSFSAAVGLFNSIINLLLIFLANKISKKVADVSLW